MFFECRQLVTVALFRSSCQSHVLSLYGFVHCQTRVFSQQSFVHYNYSRHSFLFWMSQTCLLENSCLGYHRHVYSRILVWDVTDMFTREFLSWISQTCLLENSCFGCHRHVYSRILVFDVTDMFTREFLFFMSQTCLLENFCL